MEQPILLLLAAGLLIVIAAVLWMRKPRSAAQPEPQPLPGKLWEQPQIEAAVQRFVSEIKQENQRVIDRFQQTQAQLMQELNQLQQRVQQLEQQMAAVTQQLAARPAEQGKQPAADPAAEEDALRLRNRYKRVFELQREGLSSEEIAKRLGAGRGEIELILSLAASGQGRSQ